MTGTCFFIGACYSSFIQKIAKAVQMKNSYVPILEQLIIQSEQERFSFHVPGHKNGKLFINKARPYFSSILKIDSTELTNLDDLHAPVGIIKEAETLAAKLYGSKRTFFLVNGSTVGNLAMVLATCKEGDTVLVQRNCHKSVMNACRLAKVQPVFLTTEMDDKSNIATGISEETLKIALEAFPQAKALVLTYPNYYGMTYPLKPLIDIAHEKGVAVLVDEAHGAHFTLGAPFPPSALDLGADVVVHSAHKTLPAMTMASFLHVHERSIVSEESVHQYLTMLQSSSPSYPLMASLDVARSYVASLDATRIDEIITSHAKFCEQLAKIPQWKVLQSDDPLKITLQTNCEASGIELQCRLEEQGIYVELADESHLLLVLSLAPLTEIEEIVAQMKEAVCDLPLRKEPLSFASLTLPPYTKLELTYKEMEEARKKRVPFMKAKGLIAAETIIPYPPGIPYIMEGERLSIEKIEKTMEMIRTGVRFQGNEDVLAQGIKIFER